MNEILFHTDMIGKYAKMDYLHLSTDGNNLNNFHNNLADYTIAQQREGVNGRPYEQIFKKLPIAVSRPIINTDDDNKTSLLYERTTYGYQDISGFKISNNNLPRPFIPTSKYQPILGVIH